MGAGVEKMRLIKMFSAVGLHRHYDSALPQTPGVGGDGYQTPLSAGGATRERGQSLIGPRTGSGPSEPREAGC